MVRDGVRGCDRVQGLEALCGQCLPHELVDGDCLRGDMRSLLEQLTPLQCRVLKMRYGIEVEEPMSLTGIGRELGMSRDRVRNLERDGLAGLRRLSEAVEAYVAA